MVLRKVSLSHFQSIKNSSCFAWCQFSNCPLFYKWWAFSCIIKAWKSTTNFKSPSRDPNTTYSVRSCHLLTQWILRSTAMTHFSTAHGTKSQTLITTSNLRRPNEHHFWILLCTLRHGLHRTWDPRILQASPRTGCPWLVQRDILWIFGIYARFSQWTLSNFKMTKITRSWSRSQQMTLRRQNDKCHLTPSYMQSTETPASSGSFFVKTKNQAAGFFCFSLLRVCPGPPLACV